MANPVFQPTNFASMVNLVVGDCNGVKGVERWEQETPLFVQQITACIDSSIRTVLDYGCGVGRLAKGVIESCPEIELFGVDDSPGQLQGALAYVNSERFETLLPSELNQPVDLAYCIYVLQHIPAVELREALQRIHHFLKPDGLFICCSSEYRMAVRFDMPAFFDDRFLGVNLSQEISRFFEPIAPLFDQETLDRETILQRLILGIRSEEDSNPCLPHPAFIYRRRTLEGPLFNAAFP